MADMMEKDEVLSLLCILKRNAARKTLAGRCLYAASVDLGQLCIIHFEQVSICDWR